MPATQDEVRKLRPFGMVALNCILPGLGNTVVVSHKRWTIILAFVIFQIVLQNPFPYFAFLLGSIVFGFYEMGTAGQLSSQQKLNTLPRSERPNSRLANNLVDVEDAHFTTDLMEKKERIAEELLRQQRADEEALERAQQKPVHKYDQFDPSLPGSPETEQSWIQQQIQQTLQQTVQQGQQQGQQLLTDPAVSALSPTMASAQDPWQQQQTDPAATAATDAPYVFSSGPSGQEHDPWTQQQTDPAIPVTASRPQDPWAQQLTDPGVAQSAAPYTMPNYMDSTASLLPEPQQPTVIKDMMSASSFSADLGSTGLSTAASTSPTTPLAGAAEQDNTHCQHCGYLRDHDFAFCPKCAAMF